MDKAVLEAKLPELEKRHTDLLDEAHRVEGEYRLVQNLLTQWQEDNIPEGEVIGGEKVEQAVDAQD